MRQRLDIADVEARTKIRAKYLRALENEEFGMLPGPTFVKTFLRTYAEVLGLDPQLLVEEYRAAYEPRDESRAAPAARARTGVRRDRRRPTGGPPRGPWLLIALAVVVVIGGLADHRPRRRRRRGRRPGGPRADRPRPSSRRSATEERASPPQPRRVRSCV